jgi:hypothetical protein
MLKTNMSNGSPRRCCMNRRKELWKDWRNFCDNSKAGEKNNVKALIASENVRPASIDRGWTGASA